MYMLQKYTYKYLLDREDNYLVVSDLSSCAAVRERDSERYLLCSGTMCVCVCVYVCVCVVCVCVCVWCVCVCVCGQLEKIILRDTAVEWLAFLLVFWKPCVQIPARKPPGIIDNFCGFSKSAVVYYLRLADLPLPFHMFPISVLTDQIIPHWVFPMSLHWL